jgi:hypothetical protein
MAEPTATVLAADSFTGDIDAGAVIGSGDPAGPARLGVDAEGCMSVDRGALRIEPLQVPGWGRCGLAYGPYEARGGLVACWLVLNGHNESQTEPHLDRSRRDLRHLVRAVRYRLRQQRKKRAARPAEGPVDWPTIPPRKVSAHRYHVATHENLAVGWFGSPAIGRPDGHSLLVHATRGSNGELWAPPTGDGGPRRLFDLLQNLPMYYVILLTPSGAAYYVSSTPDARGPGSYPALRPVAIDTSRAVEGPLYSGLQQAILGQVGYRAATRVYGARVAEVEEWASWYGTAHLADRHPQAAGTPEIGGPWITGEWGRFADPGDETGLIHLRLDGWSARSCVRLTWRATSPATGLELAIDRAGTRLTNRRETGSEVVATDHGACPTGAAGRDLQILDDGERISVHLGDRLVFERYVECADDGAGTGIALHTSGVTVHDLQIHPRRVRLPEALDLGMPHLDTGDETAIEDDFAGAVGELDGPWSRVLGTGLVYRTGDDAAHVVASVERPNPGRTLYLRDWHDPKFADIEVEITPPGDGRDPRDEGRGGLCIWQDRDNYLLVNLWLVSRFPGSSVSSFLRIDGHEDFFDPIWTNVGTAIRPGRAVRLRLISDGGRYLVHLDGRPVLYRAVSDIAPGADRFAIEKVGIGVNWEWGDDTGSAFRRFRARTAP